MRDVYPPPTATASLATQFSIYCLEKPKQTVREGDTAVPACKSAPTSSPSKANLASPLSYLDVVQQLDGGVEWSFAPYPPCSRAQLLQVHTYWVAIPNSATTETRRTIELKVNGGASEMPKDKESASTNSLEEAITAPRCSCGRDDRFPASSWPSVRAPRLACVVGVVWVRLSAGTRFACSLVNRRTPHSGHASASSTTATSSNIGMCRPSVEGYIQVVLTHPHYRRRGLASWLLTHCLARTEVPAGVFASDGSVGVAYTIQRWHLHTLAVARRAEKRPHDDDKATRGWAQDRMQPQQHRQDANPGKSERESNEEAIVATLAMYRQLGFHERRYLARYYSGQNDAVELMKMCSGPFIHFDAARPI
ncbi:Acetyltransferase_(GNAT)_family [Leishmania braziliensis MHOM/BR/75/M2904]|uniref:Acetyltransferase_(GNAT)_family n=1 Tax=Leishmania braziliensis MHOM/BR/75/M2904 TaxID=420245 RepID=A0A3P3ZCK8_LEIBR|nr:Acetyltransferase_(GNAT)_family [Leishmania braziliensis MHOM/BR/75/M2904]